MSEPTIHDLYVALGGDPAVADPTITQLMEAAETLAAAATPAEAADVPFDNTTAALAGAPDNLQDAIDAVAVRRGLVG